MKGKEMLKIKIDLIRMPLEKVQGTPNTYFLFFLCFIRTYASVHVCGVCGMV